ncbi:MAG: hypothetical protein VKJ02_17210 [Snowella sp.]|nr:hypothetical protein [Snowella sp.]
MDSSLQEQILELNFKVDQLHCLVLQLSKQITALSNKSLTFYNQDAKPSMSFNHFRETSSGDSEQTHSASRLFHKDVLNDEEEHFSFWTLQEDQPLSADIQVHRLTAQITAAYHRIAALEEQLIAQRVHS